MADIVKEKDLPEIMIGVAIGVILSTIVGGREEHNRGMMCDKHLILRGLN